MVCRPNDDQRKSVHAPTKNKRNRRPRVHIWVTPNPYIYRDFGRKMATQYDHKRWRGVCRPSLTGLPNELLRRIHTYLPSSLPTCLPVRRANRDPFPAVCGHLRTLFGESREECRFRQLCGRRVCCRHMPSVTLLQYLDDRVHNVGYSHFPTLRLANFARKFLVADAICCGGRGFRAIRKVNGRWCEDILWRASLPPTAGTSIEQQSID